MRRLKKTLILASVLLGVSILMGGALAMNNKQEYRKNFSVEPGTVLKVFNQTGSIHISSWDRDYIEVEAVKERYWLASLFKEPDIDVTTGNEFVIQTIYKTLLSKMISVQYRILVPQSVLVRQVETSTGKINLNTVSGDVDVKTSTGEIQIHEIKGLVKAVTSTGKINLSKISSNVEAKTSTGEIQIYETGGFVKAITGNGKINVDKVSGDVDAKTSTGEIQIHHVKGFVKAVTSNGKIDITGVGGLSEACTDNGGISVEVPAIRDSLEIRSSNGGITVFLSPEIAAQLEVTTTSGQITYGELPLTVNQSSKTKLTGRLGEGGGNINIKTSTGFINLKKLK